MNKKTKIIISVIASIVLLAVILFFLLKPKTYTVDFITNGASEIESQEVKKGETAIKPIDPVKTGYTFDGWYLNNNKYYFDSEVTKDIKLEAKWTKKEDGEKVTVTFDTDGGSKMYSIEVEKGEKLKKPEDPEKEGYIFVEWLLNNNSFNFDSEIKNDITLVAKYEKEEEGKIVVTFDSNGGSSVASQTIKKGEKATKPKNPTRTGYTFNGWYLNNKIFNFQTKLESNTKLVAGWTKNQTTQQSTPSTPQKPEEPKPEPITYYTVTFKTNGGSSVPTQTIAAGGKATKPADPTRDGYKFINWQHSGGAYDFGSSVNGNIILEANWELIPVPKVYTVSLELINGETNIPERKAIVYEDGVAITASQLQDQNGSVLGKYINSLGAIRVNKAQYDNAISLKVKLSDGTVVSATKN